MRFNRSEPGLLLSGGAHAAVLLAALFAFRAEPFDDASESVPVEIISASQLAEMMKGEREAKIQAPAPRPRVDRVAEAKDTRPPTPLDAKLEIPAPPARPPEPEKPQPVSQPPTPPERPKADDDQGARDKAAREKAAEAKAEADAKAAQLEAEALERAKAEKAKEAKAKEDKAKEDKAKADAKAKAEADAAREAKAKDAQKLAALAAEASKPAPTPKPTDKPFNPADIERLLKSKEKPQAPAATGVELNKTASLGSPTATGQKLNPGQREQLGRLLKEQLIQCWSPPANVANVDNLRPRIRMQLNQDGTLAAEPGIMNNSDDPGFRPMAESAARAVRKCAPFKIPPEFMPFYSDWRVWSVTFDAKEMLG